jgi:hypothetical protein
MVGRPRNTPSESGGSPEASGNSHTARSNSSAQEAVNKTWLSMTAVQSRLLLLQLGGMLARLIPLTQVNSTTGLTSDWAAADGQETPWFRMIGDRVIARQ